MGPLNIIQICIVSSENKIACLQWSSTGPKSNGVRVGERAVENAENSKHFHGWRLTRREIKAVKNLLRATGDAAAAEKLLRHSIAYGHSRLVIRRYLLALALGGTGLNVYDRYFSLAAQDITEDELDRVKQDVARKARALLSSGAASVAAFSGAIEPASKASPSESSEAGETSWLRAITHG